MIYICPMHPEVREDHAGLCSQCGMKLLPSQTTSDERRRPSVDKHAGHRTNIFKRKFWISLILTIPILAASDVGIRLLGQGFMGPLASPYVAFALGSIIFFYGGWVFITGAFREIRALMPGMMTLIALAISVAYAWSVFATFSFAADVLWWELATLITIMLAGHWLEMRAVSGARSSLQELSKLLPDTAEVLREGKPALVTLEDLRAGDIVLVRPGAKVPADGLVIGGSSELNESLMTGESRPVAKKKGDEVIGGSINGDGSLRVEITKIGEETFLAGIQRLIAEAEQSKSRLETLSDRAAMYLTAVAVATGGATLLGWLIAGSGTSFAIERLVAVLVVACPHALGLAIPLVAVISTAMAARSGFLIRERMALESARNIDTVLFDKTGTITAGEFSVAAVWPIRAKSEREVMQWASSVDQHSEHAIAKAILKKAKADDVPLGAVEHFSRIPGKGVEGTVSGRKIRVGSFEIGGGVLEDISANFAGTIAKAAQDGRTVVFVLDGSMVLGAIALSDAIRPESFEAVRALKNMGMDVGMISGDSAEVSGRVARELGIREYFARVMPEEKVEKVRELQHAGRKVLMVGDGVNDAAAIRAADVGVAIGAGTNVAIESAGILLVRNDPRDIAKIIALSRKTYAKMIQNLFWATGYNVLAIPLAAGVLAPWGFVLAPALSAVFMSLSTVIVALNALLLRRESIA